jgi:hypothetical protein
MDVFTGFSRGGHGDRHCLIISKATRVRSMEDYSDPDFILVYDHTTGPSSRGPEKKCEHVAMASPCIENYPRERHRRGLGPSRTFQC